MRSLGIGILVPLVLAVPVALVIAAAQPGISLAIIVGVLVLAVAFFSTTASLYLLVFSMLLGPEVLVGGLAGGAGSGRGVTLRLDDFLLIIIGFVWLAKVAIHKETVPFTRTPLNRPIMLYIAASLLATLIGMVAGRVKPMTGLFFLLKYYEYVFLYFMVVNAVTNQKQARGLVYASLVTFFLVSLFAISQIPSGQRASAPFEGESGEPNTLGGYLVFMLAIVTGLLLTRDAIPRRLPLLILIVAGSIGLLVTLSRTSFLAAGVVALATLVILGRRKPFLLPLVLIFLMVSPWWIPETVKERVMFTFTQEQTEGQVRLGGVRVDTSTSDRLRSWQDSLVFFQRSPIWGTGVTGGPFMDAMYPRVLTETGILGVIAFLAMLWAIFRVGLAAYRQAQDQFTKGAALGFLLGFMGLLVHSIGANTFIIVRIMEPFWLYAALVVRGLLMARANQSVGVESRVQPAIGGAPSTRPGGARLRKF